MFYAQSKRHYRIAITLLTILSWMWAAPSYSFSGNSALDSLIQSRVDSMKNEAIQPRFTKEVMSYIRTYTELNRSHAEQILGRTVLYFPLFEKMLRESGVPEDLKYLAIVESALDPKAISWVGAKGLWQFMPETGKYYGLKINKRMDDRCDPKKATGAAIRYLQDAYKRFGNWELAIAAYNSGGGRVSRAIKRGRSKDFWKIKRFLPRETRNYVPAFIGAQYLLEFYEEHSLKPDYPALDLQMTTELTVDHSLSFYEIAQVTGLPMDWLEWMNPVYQLGYIPASSKGRSLCIPSRMVEKVQEYLDQKKEDASWINDRVGLPVRIQPNKELTYQTSEGYEEMVLKLHPGADLPTIMNRYAVNLYQLRSWNPAWDGQMEGRSVLVVYQPSIDGKVGIWKFSEPLDPIASLPVKPLEYQQSPSDIDYQKGCTWIYTSSRMSVNQLTKRFPNLRLASFEERNDLEPGGKRIPDQEVVCVCAQDLGGD